ncbi:MAG: DUF3137 domain-containing protein [Sulfurimonas sp.]
MKSASELTDFYYKKLFPSLEKLEDDRKQLKHRIINIGILYTIVSILIISALFGASNSVDILLFSLVFYLAVGGGIYKYLVKDYTKEFKNKIISPLITALDENLNYFEELHVPAEYFTRSKIFTSKPDRINGNDFVKGNVNGVEIQFSDLHAQKKHKDSKGHTSWSTIFQGLFIVSDFNKNFKGQTIVLPDSAQSTFGNLVGNWLQANNMNRKKLVKMDSVAFEKEFVVYSSDQIEARYILSPVLMSKLLAVKKRSKHPLSVSFRGGNIFMAIAYNKDLFEPSIFHSLLKYKIAMEYVGTLHLAIGIVEELKLNQKLWSKL